MAYYPLRKIADLGGDPEKDFESIFAKLAFEFIKEKVAPIQDKFIGFQLMERTDDNEKAMGVFTYRLPNTLVFIPVFFLGGDVKGHEVLYLVDQDLVVPLKEEWVNYLNKPRPDLGELEKRRSDEYSHPEIYGFQRPYPYSPHLASATDKIVRVLRKALKHHKLAGFTESLSLDKLLYKRPQFVKAACDLLLKYPELKIGFDRFYGGINVITNAADYWQKQYRQALTDKFNKVASKLDGQLHILTEPDLCSTWEEKKYLRKYGFFVRDNRKKTASIKVVERKWSGSNPKLGGLYDLVVDLTTGKTRSPALLVPLKNHIELGQSDRNEFDQLRRAWVCALPTQVAAMAIPSKFMVDGGSKYRGMPAREQLMEVRRRFQLANPGNLEAGNYYLAVKADNIELNGFLFGVLDKAGEGLYRVVIGNAFPYDRKNVTTLRLEDGDVIDVSQNGVLLGKDVTILKLKYVVKDGRHTIRTYTSHDLREGATSIAGDPVYEEKAPVPQGAAKNDIEMFHFIFSSTGGGEYAYPGFDRYLTVKKTSSGFSFNGLPSMTKRASLLTLIQNHELDLPQAEYVLDEVVKKGEITLYKEAAPYPEEARKSIDQGGWLLQPSQTTEELLPGFENTYDKDPLRAFRVPGGHESNIGYQAEQGVADAVKGGELGYKDLFNIGLIYSLLKITDADKTVKELLVEAVPLMDQAGRTLLVFYWYNDFFRDKFGPKDLPELEELLKSTFDRAGDLVLYLQRKDSDQVTPARTSKPEIER